MTSYFEFTDGNNNYTSDQVQFVFFEKIRKDRDKVILSKFIICTPVDPLSYPNGLNFYFWDGHDESKHLVGLAQKLPYNI